MIHFQNQTYAFFMYNYVTRYLINFYIQRFQNNFIFNVCCILFCVFLGVLTFFVGTIFCHGAPKPNPVCFVCNILPFERLFLCFTVEKTYIPMFVYIFHYIAKYICYASVSMTLMLFNVSAYFNKCNVMFIKLSTNNVHMMTSWCYCFLSAITFLSVFSLQETEYSLNHW